MKQKTEIGFSTAAEIIKTLGLSFNEDYENNLNVLFSQWPEIVGEKIAKYSAPSELTDDGVMIIKCKNSIVANEIFNLRIKINEEIKKRAKKREIHCFKYIKITYNR